MIKFYKSTQTFKRRTHQDVPGWGQALIDINCPICKGLASGYIIEDEPLRGSCSECFVRFVQLGEVWHVFIPEFKIPVVESIHGKINWEKSLFTKVKVHGIIDVNHTLSTSYRMEEHIMAFTTKVTITFTDGELVEDFKADNRKVSTRNARRWIRNQGATIKGAEKVEKGKTQLAVNITIDAPIPQPEVEEDEAES